MSTMSHDDMRRHHKRLSSKGSLSSREALELSIYEAVLFNGGEITVQRDYTPPRRSESSKLWDWS
jgi:hypothetical protein